MIKKNYKYLSHSNREINKIKRRRWAAEQMVKPSLYRKKIWTDESRVEAWIRGRMRNHRKGEAQKRVAKPKKPQSVSNF